MEWSDQGVLLSVRRHGETSAIIEVFTEAHGRHAGIVRGGTSRKIAPILQPGAQVAVSWRARHEDHLGSFSVEPIKSRSVNLMSDRLTLSGLNAVTSLLLFSLPEREAQPLLYQRSHALFDMIGAEELWPYAYLRWEMALLEAMGFALDLTGCAVTGATTDLIYVSPKSGRAVSRQGAGEWADKMLPLPGCLLGQGNAPASDVLSGLNLTGYFLEHHLAQSLGNRPIPAPRQRFLECLRRQAERG